MDFNIRDYMKTAAASDQNLIIMSTMTTSTTTTTTLSSSNLSSTSTLQTTTLTSTSTTTTSTATIEEILSLIESMKHSSISSQHITTFLINICDSKTKFNEELLKKFSKIIVEKLICESPLTEILRTLDTIEYRQKLYNHHQFDFNKFLIICRYLCSSDKQGWDILGLKFFSVVWDNNFHFQQQIIRYCIVSDWIKQILSNCTHPILIKKVPQIENLKCPIEYETDCQIYCWKYQCLCQILLDLSDIQDQLTRSIVEEIFFTPLNKCPDLLVFALMECQGNHGLKETVMIKALLKFICVSHTNPNLNATLIIQKIWPNDFVCTPKMTLTWPQKALLTAMVELYTSSSPEEQSYKLSKILDLSQDLKALNVLLLSNTYSFVIDLACFASRREYLKLDKWLNDKIAQNGPQFVDACIQFLKKRCAIFGATEPATLSLTNETYRIILNCLRHYVSDPPKSMIDVEIIKMYTKFTQWVNQNQVLNATLKSNNATTNNNNSINQFDSVGSHLFTNENPIRSPQLNANQQPYSLENEEEFTKDIEEEADSYFQRIYNQDQPDSLTIDQFLDMLKKFQESSLKREKEIAACMIRNLFKEYPFLPQYPDKELVITGEIFGGIILNNFVKGHTKLDALRCVVKALNRTTEVPSRYFMFGQAALNKLKTHLKEFPQFCNHLCNIPSYRDLPPDLIEYIEYAKQGMNPPSVQQQQRITLINSNGKMNIQQQQQSTNNQSSAAAATAVLSSTNNDLQYQQQQQLEIPPSSFQDKVSFIINNLSQINIVKKADEFKELFHKDKDQYFQWFSHYFVMKRVGLESNYHELYATFMIKISMNELSIKILYETYRNIKILLRSNKETDNFSDRTLLKNLGNWLGMITLAQNKPILTRNLDLRNLLIEAYHKGQLQMIFVVPFVTKILMGSAKSRVFRPPCPWTMKLIKILVEIHSVSDLKLNLKFEVEVLCNHLELDLNDYVGKSNDLKNKDLLMKLEPQLGTSTIQRTNFIGSNNIGSVLESSSNVPPMNAMLHAAAAHPIVDNNNSIQQHHHHQQQQQQHPQHPQQQHLIANKMNTTATTVTTVPPTTPTTHHMQNYNEININNISNLSQSIDIQPNLQIIMLYPQHKNFIRSLFEKCVQEWITFVSERVIKVCMVTTETLVKKDFQHESNAELMRNAAHKMMRSLVAGYSLINTQEPLLNRIQLSLVSFFQSKPMNVTKDLIDSTIQTLINDNLEACVGFVQKTCIERAIDELDKRMKPEFEARQKLSSESGGGVGKKGSSSITSKQFQIYEEMGRNIAGFTTTTNQSTYFTTMDNIPNNNNNNNNNKTINNNANYTGGNVLSAHNAAHNYPLIHNQNNNQNNNDHNNAMNQQQVQQGANQVHVDAFVFIYDKLIKHLSELIQEFEYVHYTTEAMHQVLEILKVCKQNPREHGTAITLIKNVINGLREILLNAETVGTDYAVIQRARDFYLVLLKALTDQRVYNHRFTSINVTRSLLEHWIAMNTAFPDELFDILYRQDLINLSFLDTEFHQILENGSTGYPMLVLNFFKYYLNTINSNHFPSTLDLLQRIVAMKITQQPTNPQLIIELKHILTMARMNIPNQPINDVMDIALIESIIKDWIRFCNSKDHINGSFPHVVKSLNAQGVLKNDESISNFFKFFLEYCVERCYHIISYAVQHPGFPLNNVHLKCFEFIDSYSALVILFIKQSGNQGNWEQKFQFLMRILSILATTAYRDQEIRSKDFFSLSYYRIMLSIFIEFFYTPSNLGIQEFVINNENLFEVFKFHFVRSYCNFLHQMCPTKMPSFTYAWVDFISHRLFIGKCLDSSQQINHKTWPIYNALLMDLLIFLKPIIQSDLFIMNTSMELYKGVLKLFLILFHDFPEFLCEYCYNLIDIIPIRAVQLRNIILSANPINMPDVSNQKVDNLYEKIPHVRIPDTNLFDHLQFIPKGLESYLLHRTPNNFLTDLSQYLNQKLMNPDKQPTTFTTLINALTLFIDMSYIQTNKAVKIDLIHNSVHLEIFQHLLMNFDSQGRYILINSMIDHLRYPNNETLLFICLLLILFKDNNEHIREQIVRVLLERFITQRPHPWGVEYLINELFRNPDYNLMEHNFIKCVPEIGKYFSRSP